MESFTATEFAGLSLNKFSVFSLWLLVICMGCLLVGCSGSGIEQPDAQLDMDAGSDQGSGDLSDGQIPGDGDSADGDAGTVGDDDTDRDAGADGDGSETCTQNPAQPPFDISLPGSEENGVFDPDMELDPDTGRLWMAYSGVTGPSGNGAVSIHLAYSDDQGMTWCGGQTINKAQSVAAEDLPDGVSGLSAHWNHETPTLVREPAASPDKRWRLVWHRYLVVADGDSNPANDRRFEYGWLAERRAARPEGLFDAPEQKLFSGAAYYASPSIKAYNDSSPGGLPQTDWRTNSTLASCIVFAEPGALGTQDGLELTTFCAKSATDTQVVLLHFSEAEDTWSYRSTLLGPADALVFDQSYTGFNGVGLFALADGGVGLTATPTNDAYKGCVIFSLDLARGTLVDEDQNGPDVLYLLGPSTTPGVFHSGACAYNTAYAYGLLASEAHTTGMVFRVRATGERITP